MKWARLTASAAALLMITAMFAGCGGKTNPTSSTAKTADTTGGSAETTDPSADASDPTGENTEPGESTVDTTDGQGGPQTPTNSGDKINATKSTTAGASASTAVGGTKFGVTSTRKMPNYISKISSPVLKYLSSDKPDDKTQAEMNKAFKAVTGKDLQFVPTVVDWNTLPDRLAGMVKANQAPDIVKYASIMSPYLVQKPYFQDLNQYIDMDDALWKIAKPYNPDYLTVKGKRYGVIAYGKPANDGISLTNGYVYNVALVKEAIDGNKDLYDPVQMFLDGKWTWDALYAFAEEITTDDNNDGVPEIYGHVMEGSRVNAFIASAGQDIIKIDANGKFVYNLEHADVLRALNFVKKLGKLSNDPAPWDGLKNVIAKKAGFFYGNMWWMKDSSASIEATKKGQIAFVPFPRDPNTKNYYVSNTDGNTWFIPLNAKNPYLAAAYLYFNQYSSYNPNRAVQKANEDLMKNTYCWNQQMIDFTTAKVKVANVTPITTGVGERMDGFKADIFWGDAFNPDKVVSKTIEEVAPGLKAGISRYNNAK